jgi:cytochrome c553
MRNLYIAIFVLFLIGCNQTPKPETAVQSDTKAPTVFSQTGPATFATCTACHGSNAEGNKALNAPALAGQDAWYMKQQLRNFRVGLRGKDKRDTAGMQMAAIALSLPDTQTMDAIVDHIKTLAAAPVARSINGDLENGYERYNMICGACHGAGAVGNKELKSPRLTGINDWYLRRQLIHFKNGTRGAHPADISGAQMAAMAGTLEDEKAIDNVVAFIQSMNEKKP